MTTTQIDRIMVPLVTVAAIVIVAVAWVTIHHRNAYQDACTAAGGVAVKASRAHRVCIDQDTIIEVHL